MGWPRVTARGGLEVTLICKFKGRLADGSEWEKRIRLCCAVMSKAGEQRKVSLAFRVLGFRDEEFCKFLRQLCGNIWRQLRASLQLQKDLRAAYASGVNSHIEFGSLVKCVQGEAQACPKLTGQVDRE